jgi:hypothetical protein
MQGTSIQAQHATRTVRGLLTLLISTDGWSYPVESTDAACGVYRRDSGKNGVVPRGLLTKLLREQLKPFK